MTVAGQFLFAATFDAPPVVRFGTTSQVSTRAAGQHADGLDRISVQVPGKFTESRVEVVVQSLSGSASAAVSLPVET